MNHRKHAARICFLWAFVSFSAGCRQIEPLPATTQEVDETGDVAVYAALCRFWERCRPERLNVYSEGTVDKCIDYYRCALSTHRDNSKSLFADRDACIDFIDNAVCDLEITAYIVRPSMGVDASDPAGAVGIVSGPTWDILNDLKDHPACKGSDVPRLNTPPGDPCFVQPRFCEEGYYCKASPGRESRGYSFCGTCEKPAALGDLCDASILCESGAQCDGSVCIPLLSNGASCASAGECASGVCAVSVCAALGEAGAPCDGNDDCEDQYCTKAGVCVERVFATLGESCEDVYSSEPIYCDPGIGLVCGHGQCVPLADEGEACRQTAECRIDLICIEDTCRSRECPGQEGAYCDLDLTTCTDDLLCDPDTRTCTPRSAVGESCRSASDCEQDLFCHRNFDEDVGVCALPREIGAPCSENDECKDEYCDLSPWDCEVISPERVGCQMTRCDDCGTCAPLPDVSSCPEAGSP